VGWLFRNQQQTRRKSELLVFLTPRVMAESTPAAEMVGSVATTPDPRPAPALGR
jgi:type II secretory pathway component GspD/PulD (secretin)